jgi:calcineurin-like phosphoesterase family protein
MERYTAEEAKRIWLISDTHFDHANIIRYCGRPFDSVEIMNRTMLDNWNNTVAPDNLVYFLGDMTFGRNHREAGYWLSRLNGRKIFVRGSHDWREEINGDNILKVVDIETIQVEGVSFLLIHDAFSPAVNSWDGWIIHGHTHNHTPSLNNGRRINVSVEVIGYKPVSLYKILATIRER